MITLEQAGDNIGAYVVYRAPGRERQEMGQIISVSNLLVFVRYEGRTQPQGTYPAELDWYSIPRSDT